MNPNKYFPPAHSQELFNKGMPADAAWLIQSNFELGQGYVKQKPKLLRMEDVPPPHKRYRNQYYYPAIAIPPIEFKPKSS